MPSQPAHDVFMPPQVKQVSFSYPLLGTPSQPAQVELSPAHTWQVSLTYPLHGTPSQPAQLVLSPCGTKLQHFVVKDWGAAQAWGGVELGVAGVAIRRGGACSHSPRIPTGGIVAPRDETSVPARRVVAVIHLRQAWSAIAQSSLPPPTHRCEIVWHN